MVVSAPAAGRNGRSSSGLRRAAASLCAVLAAALPLAGPASAGGYDTGEQDWDILFSQGPVTVEAAVRHIRPERRLGRIVGVLGPSPDADEAAPFALPRFGVALRLGDAVRCAAAYREPWGGHADYGSAWTYAFSAIEQHFSSRDLGATCALALPIDEGRLSVLAGLSHQQIRYELIQSGGPGISRTTEVSDGAIGWRAGLAYEIPAYALRASLIYQSQIDYDMDGEVSVGGFAGTPVYGSIAMPQSAELKVQSGVAPGWLAFAAVKWTDWSVAGSMPLCAAGTPLCTQAFAVSGLTLLWEDSWTVTAGAAHQVSDVFTLAGSLTWDQGASAGFTSQTDTWVVGLTGIFTPGDAIALRLGGSVGLLEGGTLSTLVLPDGIANPVGYTARFGDDLVYSASLSVALRY